MKRRSSWSTRRTHYGRRGFRVGVSINPLTRKLLAGTSADFNGYAVGY